ncbi:MAG TPA: thioredoxin [Syntrophales bacterium]|nr:thioredoxin [Syntrophales bacterium]
MAAGEHLLHLNDSNYEEKISKSTKPVLVDFWAPWCGPCKAIGPVIEELAETYKDRVVIAKLNVDESRNAASTYGVRSIPTLIIFKEGKVFDTIIGLVPKERLEEFINKAL